MSKLKKELLLMGRKWADAFPTIFVSIFLFLTIYRIFGITQIILVSFLTLLFRIRSSKGFDIWELLWCYLIQLVLFIVAYLATLNLVFCIILNLVVPFLLVFLLTDKFNPKAYFVYGMEFVLLQMVPITRGQIPARLLALLYGYSFVTLALFFYSKVIKKRRNYGTVRKGINNLAIQLEKLADGQKDPADTYELVKMMYHMNQVIYTSRNYNYLATGYGRINYYFMLVFQRFRYFVENVLDDASLGSEQNQSYFRKLSGVFYEIEKEINQSDNSSLARKVQKMLAEESLDSERVNEGMMKILRLLSFALLKMTEVSKNRSEKEWKIPDITHKIKGAKGQFHLSQFHIRFALRLSIVLCITFSFCRATSLEHSYWYPMSAFLMLMPYSEESVMKINNRVIGTVGGLFVTFFLTGIFKSLNAHIVILLIMTCLMYAAPATSWTMSMYSTCYGLSLTTLSLPQGEAIELRLVYVLAAVATVLLANRFILPNTAKEEFLKSVNALLDIDEAMVREVRKSMACQSDRNMLRELMVQFNLASEDIENYIKRNMNKEEQEFYQQFLPLNRRLVTEIEQIDSYIRENKAPLEGNIILNEILRNIERAFKKIRKSYTKKELSSSIMTGMEEKTYGSMDDALYFNNLALNCLETTNNIVALLNQNIQGQEDEE